MNELTRIEAAMDPTPLDDIYATPSELALAKQLDHVDAHAAGFIAASPFLVLASADLEGRCDASPRGDAPGFVKVANERLLRLPDRPGNNRIDSLRNIESNPQVGLLFFVPGVIETLRVNGRARWVDDPALLDQMAVDGKRPRSILEISVCEVFFHCGKALKRSELWDSSKNAGAHPRLPSLGRILADQTGQISVEEAEARITEAYAKHLY
jgi:PPOX class probable FMN-dependent enzyme